MKSIATGFSRVLASGMAALACVLAGEAGACTTAAWIATVGTTVAAEPFQSPPASRYEGRCALIGNLAQPGYLVTNSPQSESIYSVQFYVFTGASGGSPTILRALSADSGGATVVDIVYNAVAEQVEFAVAGATVPPIAGVPRDRWVAIRFLYRSGGNFEASVLHRGVEASTASATAADVALIEAAQWGVIDAGGASGTMYFDYFDSGRSQTPIAALCRGDADANSTIASLDALRIADERVARTLATGQPDCNEDGVVNVLDAACVHRRRIDGAGCGALGKIMQWKGPSADKIFLDSLESP